MTTVFEFYHKEKQKWLKRTLHGHLTADYISGYVLKNGGDEWRMISFDVPDLKVNEVREVVISVTRIQHDKIWPSEE